jgi:hypothetical protein
MPPGDPHYQMHAPDLWHRITEYYRTSLREPTIETRTLAVWCARINNDSQLRRWHANHQPIHLIRGPDPRDRSKYYTLHPGIASEQIQVHANGPSVDPP